MTKAKNVRDAATGQFVDESEAARRPKETVVETVTTPKGKTMKKATTKKAATTAAKAPAARNARPARKPAATTSKPVQAAAISVPATVEDQTKAAASQKSPTAPTRLKADALANAFREVATRDGYYSKEIGGKIALTGRFDLGEILVIAHKASK